MPIIDTTPPFKIFSVKLPPRLEEEIKAIARDEYNTASSVARRLLILGLRIERTRNTLVGKVAR